MNDDEILRIVQRPTADEMDARFAPLWQAADAAIRSDVGLVVELAKAAGAVARGDRVPPVQRSPHDSVVADERRAASRGGSAPMARTEG